MTSLSWTRGSSLFICLSVLRVTLGMAPSTSGNNRRETKFLVLGGGLGGLSAVKNLVDRGETDFLILEGSDRVGGRIKSVQFGGKTVEVGAQWLHGGGIKDPVFTLASRTNLVTRSSEYQDVVVFNDTGHDVTETINTRWDAYDQALQQTLAFGTRLRTTEADVPDMSLRSALSLHGWNPRHGTDYALEYYDLDLNYGHRAETISSRYSFTPSFGKSYQEKLVLDQSGGLHKVIGVLANDIRGFRPNDGRLQLNTIVKTIKHSDTGVEVTTTDGRVFVGQYAIVTFSLGVLQKGAVAFDPPLPDWKKYSIAGATFVSDFPVYVKFPSSFWTDAEFALYGSNRRGHYTLWQNFNKFWPGSNILQIQISGSEAERIARMESTNTVSNEITTILRKIYGNRIPNPSQILVPDWLTNPLFHGCYSDWSPAYLASSHDALRAPVGRLYFAGEAYHKKWFGYMQGAILSGREESDKLLDCVADMSECEFYVPPYQARGCTYKEASNYDAKAQIDDGSCKIAAGGATNDVSSFVYSTATVISTAFLYSLASFVRT